MYNRSSLFGQQIVAVNFTHSIKAKIKGDFYQTFSQVEVLYRVLFIVVQWYGKRYTLAVLRSKLQARSKTDNNSCTLNSTRPEPHHQYNSAAISTYLSYLPVAKSCTPCGRRRMSTEQNTPVRAIVGAAQRIIKARSIGTASRHHP